MLLQLGGFGFPLAQVLCLKLLEGRLCLLIHFLKLGELAFLFRSGSVQLRDHFFKCRLHFRKRLLRHAAVTDGTIHTGVKCFVRGHFALIPCAQIVDSCIGFRHRLCEFRLVLLCLPADDPFPQLLKGFLLLRSVAAHILYRLIVEAAQLYEPLLHTGGVETGKLLFLQRGDLCLETVQLVGKLDPRLLLLLLLRGGKVPLSAKVGDAFLKTTNIFAPALEIGVRR